MGAAWQVSPAALLSLLAASPCHLHACPMSCPRRLRIGMPSACCGISSGATRQHGEPHRLPDSAHSPVLDVGRVVAWRSRRCSCPAVLSAARVSGPCHKHRLMCHLSCLCCRAGGTLQRLPPASGLARPISRQVAVCCSWPCVAADLDSNLVQCILDGHALTVDAAAGTACRLRTSCLCCCRYCLSVAH